MTHKWVGHLTGRAALVAAALTATAAVMLAPASAYAAPSGLFVGNYAGTTISQFTIGASGLLSANGTVGTGNDSWTMAASPNGKYVYATNYSDGTLSQYAVGADGALTPLSPATVATGSQPEQVAVSPDGKNVYVANHGAGSVSVYTVGSDGTLTLASTVTTDLTAPTGLAISPDGSSVYVGDEAPRIVEFDRSSDGSLTPKSTPTIPTVTAGTIDLAITPNGKYVYVSGSSTALIDEYAVGSGGELAPEPVASVPEGTSNYQVTVSPNGQNLYASSCDDNAVFQYSISSTGELSPLTPASVASGGACPELQWMTANGANLYAPDYGTNGGNGDVSQFSVSSTGALTLKSPATVPAGPGASDLTIPPDQGPVAAFSTTVKGRTAQLDASKSTDSDGTVVSYHWSFGDGNSLTTSSSMVSHTYGKAGTYTVTLTVTDDSGCSTTQVFTGQTAYCNGGKAASTSQMVTVAAPKVLKLKLKVTPNRTKAGHRTCFVFRATSGGHGVKHVLVRLAGHATHTGRTGTAKLCLALRKGVHTARASKKGYKTGTARIRVSAAAPSFTG